MQAFIEDRTQGIEGKFKDPIKKMTNLNTFSQMAHAQFLGYNRKKKNYK